MKEEIKSIFEIIDAINNKKDKWSYLTSIDYILKSSLYMDSLYADSNVVYKNINKKLKILNLGIALLVLIYYLLHYSKSCYFANFNNFLLQQKF